MLHNAYFKMYVIISVAMFCITAEHVPYTSIMNFKEFGGTV